MEASTTSVGINGKQLSDEFEYWLKPTNRPFVISISGPWGSGKTFWWKNFIQSKATEKHIYVSLFGISTFAELEQRMVSAILGTEDNQSSNRITKGISTLKKLAEVASGGLTGAALSALADYTRAVVMDGLYSRLDKFVVVIDDIERRSESLKLDQILGFVSRLREDWKASLVLILNQAKLERKDEDLLNEFREKVVDTDYLFVTTPSQAAGIGLKDIDWAVQPASQFGEKVGLTNIRIYQRIARALRRLKIDTAKLPAGVAERVVHSISAFCWSIFSKGTDIPTPDELLQVDRTRLEVWKLKKAPEQEKSPASREEKIIGVLDALHWRPDGMDQLVCAFLKGGHVNDEALTGQLQVYLNDHELAKARVAHVSYWDKFHGSFSISDDEFSKEIEDAFQKYPQYSDLSLLASVKEILNEIGKSELAKTIENRQFVQWEKLDRRTLLRIGERNFGADEELRDRFSGLMDQKPAYKSIEQVVCFFENNHSRWNSDEPKYLSHLTKEDWNTYLKSAIRSDLIAGTLVRIRRAYASLAQQGANTQPQESPLDVALREISTSGSRLNQLQIRKLLNTN